MALKSLRIYNLFPKLVGRVDQWSQYVPHAKNMGFNTIWINPIEQHSTKPVAHELNAVGSCYAIKTFGQIDHRYSLSGKVDDYTDDIKLKDYAELRNFSDHCRSEGILPMIDIVLMHVAVDNLLVTGADPQYSGSKQWFKRHPDGSIAHHQSASSGTIWSDVAPINYEDPDVLQATKFFWRERLDAYAKMGFTDFRCDTASRIPPEILEDLIDYSSQLKNDKSIWIAETVGTQWHLIKNMHGIGKQSHGFHSTYLSTQYWNGSDTWLNQERTVLFPIGLPVGAPETHDTSERFRSYARHTTDGTDASILREMTKKYALAAFMSDGIMMPIGYEYKLFKSMDVFRSIPSDLDECALDNSLISNILEINFALDLISQKKPAELAALEECACAGVMDRPYWDEKELCVFKRTSTTGNSYILLNVNPETTLLGAIEKYQEYIGEQYPDMDIGSLINCKGNIGIINNNKQSEFKLTAEAGKNLSLEDLKEGERILYASRKNYKGTLNRISCDDLTRHFTASKTHYNPLDEEILKGFFEQATGIKLSNGTTFRQLTVGHQNDKYAVFKPREEIPFYVLTIHVNRGGLDSGRDYGIKNFEDYVSSTHKIQISACDAGYPVVRPSKLLYLGVHDNYAAETAVTAAPFVKGHRPQQQDLSSEFFLRLGTLIKEFHRISTNVNFTDTAQPSCWSAPSAIETIRDLKNRCNIGQSLERMARHGGELQVQTIQALNQGILEQIIQAVIIADLTLAQLDSPQVCIHGDITSSNVMLDSSEKINAVFDFGWSGIHYPSMDLANTILTDLGGNLDDPRVKFLLQGYESEASRDVLNASMVILAATRLLNSLKFTITQPERFSSSTKLHYLDFLKQTMPTVFYQSFGNIGREIS